MKTALLIISILLIIIVLLQSGKAEAATQILSGGTTDLFRNRKERGAELNYVFRTFIFCNLLSVNVYIELRFFFYEKI